MPYLAAAMAGASIANGIYGANKSASSAKQANKLSLLSQVMAQNHEINKMKNAYQWTVEDMEKAGINPVLGAVNNGAGAGSGAGPAVSGQQSQEGQIFAQGVQSAVAAAQNQQQINNDTQRANTESAKNIATTAKTMEEAGILSKTGEKKALAEINNLTASAKNVSNTIGGAAQGAFYGVTNTAKKAYNAIKNTKGANNKKEFYKNVMFN